MSADYQLALDEIADPPSAAAIQQARDPHGIVPAAFWDRYDSIRDAERAVENPDRRRCRSCRGTNIVQKATAGGLGPGNRRPEDWTCRTCGAHFDAPLAPKGEEAGQQSLAEVSR